MVGTVDWQELDAADPVKHAAILDAARHWALRVETAQAMQAEAAKDVSAATNWAAVARSIHARHTRELSRAYVPRKAAS